MLIETFKLELMHATGNNMEILFYLSSNIKSVNSKMKKNIHKRTGNKSCHRLYKVKPIRLPSNHYDNVIYRLFSI